VSLSRIARYHFWGCWSSSWARRWESRVEFRIKRVLWARPDRKGRRKGEVVKRGYLLKIVAPCSREQSGERRRAYNKKKQSKTLMHAMERSRQSPSCVFPLDLFPRVTETRQTNPCRDQGPEHCGLGRTGSSLAGWVPLQTTTPTLPSKSQGAPAAASFSA
jgi:hypothetical protein